jgi:hypothetical protein
VPDHLPHEHFEFFRIDVHSSLHFLAEQQAHQPAYAGAAVKLEESCFAWPVWCSVAFSGRPQTPRVDSDTRIDARAVGGWV